VNLGEMRKQVLFQFNNDTDPADDYEYMPHINDYINAGYDLLMYAYKEEPAPKLTHDLEIPDLPDWSHRGIVDYATYLIYRNGSSARQSRGQEYLRNFYEVQQRLRETGPGTKGPKHFHNIPDTPETRFPIGFTVASDPLDRW